MAIDTEDNEGNEAENNLRSLRLLLLQDFYFALHRLTANGCGRNGRDNLSNSDR